MENKIKKTTENKTLTFEGAGWDKAESNGVGNCRIGATFVNDQGLRIYLELRGQKKHQYLVPSLQKFDFPWHITDLHECLDGSSKRKEEDQAFAQSDLWKITEEYTKENILNFVNNHLKCSFGSIEIKNSGWSRFEDQSQGGLK